MLTSLACFRRLARCARALSRSIFLVMSIDATQLDTLGPGLHCFEGQVSLDALGLVVFPVRSTVVELDGGGVLVIAPVGADEAVLKAVTALGPVRYVVSPNLFHHLYLNRWASRFPEAEVLVPPGLHKKRPRLPASFNCWDEGLPPEVGASVESLSISGIPRLNEIVFFHRRSSTLILTDLAFNIRAPRGLLTNIVLRAVGGYERCATSKLIKMVTQDKDALARSAKPIFDWPFERIVLGHGKIIDVDARNTLAEALSWVLGDTAGPG